MLAVRQMGHMATWHLVDAPKFTGLLHGALDALALFASGSLVSSENRTMRRIIGCVIAATGFVAGCGASYPAPTQPMADVQAADRSAKELGAASVPQATLHLKYAEEERTQAAVFMKNGDNERAAALLVRAKADAELAVALAHESKAKADVQETVEKTQKTTNTTNAGVQQ